MTQNLVNIIEYNKCKEVYLRSAQDLNTRISLEKSNVKIPENKKLNVSKRLYECSNGHFRTLLIYQINDYTLLQIREK